MRKFKRIPITKNIDFYIDLKRIVLGIGYSYEEMDERPHLIAISLGILSIEILF